jgi:transposase
MALYGIDLHSDSMTGASIAGLGAGQQRLSFSLSLSGPRFEQFLENLGAGDVILIEATTGAFWFYDQVAERVAGCYVLNPHKMESYGNKTDRIDAGRLLDLLCYHELMTVELRKRPYVYVPPREVRELRGLLTTYQLLKKQITQTLNRIHSIYKQNGIRLEKSKLSSSRYRQSILTERVLPSLWSIQVVALINTLEAFEVEKKQLQDVICVRGYSLFPEQIRLLLSIKGFSVLTATALMADVVTVDRFPNAKAFCCYLRTAPRVRASADTVHLGRTNKQGRSLSCTLLTQSVIHFSSPGTPLARFKERISAGKRPCTVRMAVIRKVLTSAYNMLSRSQLHNQIDRASYERKLSELDRLVHGYERRQADYKEVTIAAS